MSARIYQAQIDVAADSTVVVDGLHDRATVFIEGQRIGTLERDRQLSLALPGGGRRAKLTIVVESLGRINYGPRTGEGKGIMRGVRIGGRRYVHGWTHRALSRDAPPSVDARVASAPTDGGFDGVARATIEVDSAADA